MAFPLMIHINSTRRELAKDVFFALLHIEILANVLLLALLPFAAVAIARAGVLHPNFRLINLSTIVHYYLGVFARMVIVYYEVYDLPVTTSDWLIVVADVIRDQMIGYMISLIGMISFERYVATLWWKWYERRGYSTLCVFLIAELIGSGPSLLNVVLCELGYYRHEINFVVFGVIVLLSGLIYQIAYRGNKRILRSLNAFSSSYTVNQLFQVKENLRVLEFASSIIYSSVPFTAISFILYGIFFFAPSHFELARYLSIALFDCSLALYVPYFCIVAGHGMSEYHRELYKIRVIRRVAALVGWKAPPSPNSVERHNRSSKTENTHNYFNQLTKTWI